MEQWRSLGAAVIKELRQLKLSYGAIFCDADDHIIQSIVEGAYLGDYQYLDKRSGSAAKRSVMKCSIISDSSRIATAKTAVRAGTQVAEAQNLARRIADMPGNLCYPYSFVSYAQQAFSDGACRLKITKGVNALAKARFPGLVQVGQVASIHLLCSNHYRQS